MWGGANSNPANGARRGRNGPRTAGSGGGNDGYHNDSSWSDTGWQNDYSKGVENTGGRSGGNYREGGSNGGYSGGYRDQSGGKGGHGGGYAGNGGDRNGSFRESTTANYGNSQRPSPFGAAGPAGDTNRSVGASSQRTSPFGAAGPAVDVPRSGAIGAKYVPPALRNGGGDDGADYGGSHGYNSYSGDYTKGGKSDGRDRYESRSYDNASYGAGGGDRAGKSRGKDNGGYTYDDGRNGGKGGKAGKAKGRDRDEIDNSRSDHGYKGGGKGENGKQAKGGKTNGKSDSGMVYEGSGKGESSKQGKGGKSNGKAESGTGGKGNKSKGRPSYDDDEDEPPVKNAKSRSGGSGQVTGSHLSDQAFSSLSVSRETKRAMAEAFGYELMTQIQAEAIPPLLDGQDVLARARTGTGKTLAFMIPIIEIVRQYPAGVGGSISALVLSPTRELAQQIHDEAKLILDYHRKLGILCFYGGTSIKGDFRDLSQKPCDILVATPGRLQDHLDNTEDFSRRLGELSILVLDEADQLLETGFRDAILKILKFLPAPKNRQGALFSATFPAAVNEIAKLALRPKHALINTVTDEVTPDQIAQSAAVTDIDGMTELLWSALSSEMKREPKNYKIMVFFVAARVTQLYSEMFNAAGISVHEIHSRKSQAHRTKAADTFRKEQRGIVFSSDVLARGMDFPSVTSVIQVGVPSARDQYIHRLGRTGRAGRSGGCILLLHDFEQYFLKTISDLPVKRLNGKSPFPGASAAPDALWSPPYHKTGCQAYQAWLGYYNSAKGLGWKKDHLVEQATRFAESISALTDEGLPPPILKKTVGKMGLKGVQGLNLVNQLQYEDD